MGRQLPVRFQVLGREKRILGELQSRMAACGYLLPAGSARANSKIFVHPIQSRRDFRL